LGGGGGGWGSKHCEKTMSFKNLSLTTNNRSNYIFEDTLFGKRGRVQRGDGTKKHGPSEKEGKRSRKINNWGRWLSIALTL